MGVGDVRVGDRDAGLLHVGDVGEALRSGRAEAGEARVERGRRRRERRALVLESTDDGLPVEVDQVAVGVGHLAAVVHDVRRRRRSPA